MNNLEVIDAWKRWVADTENDAADVFPAEVDEAVHWFDAKQHDAALKHFRAFARSGDGDVVALWSESGKDFEKAPVVVLGGEGELGLIASSAAEALAVFAASGSEGLSSTLAYGSIDANEELAEFVSKRLETKVPEEFSLDKARTATFAAFIEKMTGNEYRCFGD